MTDDWFPAMTPELVNRCAQAAHETNRVYCQSLGDHSQPHWEDAAEIIRESVRDGVRFVWKRGVETEPGDSHQNWLDYKIKEGWVLGSIKDTVAKTHPNIKPFKELPITEQRKDALFIVVVVSMASVIWAPAEMGV
jgi:hypothetical protein